MQLKQAAFAALTVFGIATSAAAPAVAQEDPDNNGRYTIVSGFVATGPAGAEQRVTLLLDTQVGRTWMMATSTAEGIHWVRLQMKFLAKVPDHMMLRPGPVAPITPPK